jgi:hypothetical protein
MTPIQTLRTNPIKTNELFANLAQTGPGAVKARERFFLELKRELDQLGQLEEQHLLPALKKHEATKALVTPALANLRETRALLTELDAMPKEGDEFPAKIVQLKKLFAQKRPKPWRAGSQAGRNRSRVRRSGQKSCGALTSGMTANRLGSKRLRRMPPSSVWTKPLSRCSAPSPRQPKRYEPARRQWVRGLSKGFALQPMSLSVRPSGFPGSSRALRKQLATLRLLLGMAPSLLEAFRASHVNGSAGRKPALKLA